MIEIIPGTKSKFRIVNAIYENPGINVTALIKKVKVSPNLVLEYVNQLSANNIIKEERSGGKKKVHIRNLKPNFDNEAAQIIYSMIETNKKDLFLKKYNNLNPFFLQLSDLKNIEFILVYGSFARLGSDKESDLDVLIVGQLNKEQITRIREVFVTLENELSLKIETMKSFLQNKEKPLFQNILKEHVVLSGAFNYIKVLNKLKI